MRYVAGMIVEVSNGKSQFSAQDRRRKLGYEFFSGIGFATEPVFEIAIQPG